MRESGIGNGVHQPRSALGPRGGSGALLGTSVRGEDEEGASWRGRRRAGEPAPRGRGGGGPRPLLAVQEDRRAVWALRAGVLQGFVLQEVQGTRRVHRETGRVPVHLLPPPVDTANGGRRCRWSGASRILGEDECGLLVISNG